MMNKNVKDVLLYTFLIGCFYLFLEDASYHIEKGKLKARRRYA